MKIRPELQKLLHQLQDSEDFDVTRDGSYSIVVRRLSDNATVNLDSRMKATEFPQYQRVLKNKFGWPPEAKTTKQQGKTTKQALAKPASPAPAPSPAPSPRSAAPAEPEALDLPLAPTDGPDIMEAGLPDSDFVLLIPDAPYQPRAEIITPERANEIVTKIPTYQRHVKHNHKETLKRKMRNGEWSLIPSDVICFDHEGKALNGLHRMLAVSETGLPQPFYVAYNVSPELFAKIDRNARRTTGDTLHSLGEVNVGRLGPAARIMWLLDNVEEQSYWETAARQITDDEVTETIDKHPGLRRSSADADLARIKVRSSGAVVAHYLCTQACSGDPFLPDLFWECLRYNEGTWRDHPIQTVRDYFLGAGSSRRKKVKEREIALLQLYLLIRAWDLTAQGKSMANVSYKDVVIRRPREPSKTKAFFPLGPVEHR